MANENRKSSKGISKSQETSLTKLVLKESVTVLNFLSFGAVKLFQLRRLVSAVAIAKCS